MALNVDVLLTKNQYYKKKLKKQNCSLNFSFLLSLNLLNKIKKKQKTTEIVHINKYKQNNNQNSTYK